MRTRHSDNKWKGIGLNITRNQVLRKGNIKQKTKTAAKDGKEKRLKRTEVENEGIHKIYNTNDNNNVLYLATDEEQTKTT